MTLFTSDIDANAKHASRTSFVYLLISLFCLLFGAVYEMYSHEVYSYYMIYAFCFPLVGGTLAFRILSFLKWMKYPSVASRSLYHSGIATLTVGSLVRGVLDIYGTTNALSAYYWQIGFLLSGIGIIVYLIASIRNKQ